MIISPAAGKLPGINAAKGKVHTETQTYYNHSTPTQHPTTINLSSKL